MALSTPSQLVPLVHLVAVFMLIKVITYAGGMLTVQPVVAPVITLFPLLFTPVNGDSGSVVAAVTQSVVALLMADGVGGHMVGGVMLAVVVRMWLVNNAKIGQIAEAAPTLILLAVGLVVAALRHKQILNILPAELLMVVGQLGVLAHQLVATELKQEHVPIQHHLAAEPPVWDLLLKLVMLNPL